MDLSKQQVRSINIDKKMYLYKRQYYTVYICTYYIIINNIILGTVVYYIFILHVYCIPYIQGRYVIPFH